MTERHASERWRDAGRLVVGGVVALAFGALPGAATAHLDLLEDWRPEVALYVFGSLSLLVLWSLGELSPASPRWRWMFFCTVTFAGDALGRCLTLHFYYS